MMLDNWTMPPTLYGKSPAKADLDAAFLRDISDVKSTREARADYSPRAGCSESGERRMYGGPRPMWQPRSSAPTRSSTTSGV